MNIYSIEAFNNIQLQVKEIWISLKSNSTNPILKNQVPVFYIQKSTCILHSKVYFEQFHT
jgi:hypothetical protein